MYINEKQFVSDTLSISCLVVAGVSFLISHTFTLLMAIGFLYLAGLRED